MKPLEMVLAFIVAVGPLIILHELGHYTIARLCGVKVLRFSIGLGRVVWSRRFGADQTEWAISAWPLGGYVKMLDERNGEMAGVSEAELKREFTRQSVWRRMAIIAAGPLTNFLIAIVVFACLFMVGVPDPATRLRAAEPASAVYLAGLRGGETVVAVNGEAVASWSELRWALMQAVLDKTDARLDVRQAGGGQTAVTLPASALRNVNIDGDVLGELGLQLQRPKPVVVEVVAGDPGARAGLQVGDLVTAIDGHPVADGIAMIDMVRPSLGKTLVIDGLRGGQPFSVKVTPVPDPSGKAGRIGIRPDMTPAMVTVSDSPGRALVKSLHKTWDFSVMQLKMIGKMVGGEISLKNVTGPITIADYAGQTARLGPVVFLGFIAAISISLGVMNLLPIPVLDGGLLLYYSLEVLTGRPLSARVGEFAQRLGVGLLVMLMALAVFNDVARLL
ncbi:MAG: RIP metalloprotease RseP [Massilia sp.]